MNKIITLLSQDDILMRKPVTILLGILFVFSNIASFAQKEDLLKSDTIIETHNLNKEQWHLWDSIDNYWLKNEFPVCLKNNKLKLSCSGCESIYLVVNFYIDKEGKLTKYDIVKEKVCGKTATTALKKCFLSYFQTLVFPPHLRNINIQVRLGNGLKC
jgi:hypothetical protein